jgi:hypothetical protein
METTHDLVQYFERHRDYRGHHSRLVDCYWEHPVV